MTFKNLSVREARMELHFAIFGGNKQKIAEAEKRLQAALIKVAQKRRKPTPNVSCCSVPVTQRPERGFDFPIR